MPQAAQAATEYLLDAWQRTILTWDVLRERGNQYLEHAKSGNPPVLVFDYETVIDGRELPKPANYALVRVKPPAGYPAADPKKRPFVVIDPRAGHGPGIGGFKIDSEIGIALKVGHPCYFVMFYPQPVPGQTIESVCSAEAQFMLKVNELHPDAEGKPFVIGNCQGGWALMMLAALAPQLVGPILLAGSPISYWAGVAGKNPMRYSGGLLGGTWMASLAGDLGHGKFDGAYLVNNFENLNPSNTYWTKLYNLYAKVDTERERFLEFEKWWGGHYLMNKEEMEWISQNLFVGNKLAVGEVAVVRRQAPRRHPQHPLADRRVRLLGRQHHPAAAGARLDPRSLSQRRGDPPERADHRLLPARKDRPPRHLRVGGRGEARDRRARRARSSSSTRCRRGCTRRSSPTRSPTCRGSSTSTGATSSSSRRGRSTTSSSSTTAARTSRRSRS